MFFIRRELVQMGKKNMLMTMTIGKIYLGRMKPKRK
jgi:hypothetical protein